MLGSSSANGTTDPIVDFVRNDRMQRQARLGSLPARLQPFAPGTDRDTIDSHPDPLTLPKRSVSTRLPLKRNLSQAFTDAKSSPTQMFSSPYGPFTYPSPAESGSRLSYGFPSAPRSSSLAPKPKLSYSQSLIEHLVPSPSPSYDLLPTPRSDIPALRLNSTASHALRRNSDLLPRALPNVTGGEARDYTNSTWFCEMCYEDSADMNAMTEHLRDFHAVAADLVWFTPDKDVVCSPPNSLSLDVFDLFIFFDFLFESGTME
jgi:hypothetical protein